jgi:hypothetical protein
MQGEGDEDLWPVEASIKKKFNIYIITYFSLYPPPVHTNENRRRKINSFLAIRHPL